MSASTRTTAMMTKDDAIKLLEQALNLATQKGVYTIADVEAIIDALKCVRESYKNSMVSEK